jgi:SOS response associated peptidase (SRAP)
LQLEPRLQQTIARGGSRHRHLGLQDQSVEVATDQPADGDLALLRVVCNDDTKLPRGELPGHGQIDVEEKSGLQPWMVNGAALVTDIHDRIPVILAPADYDRWLGEEPDLRDLMKPYSAEPMRMWPISTRVNKPENNDPSIVEPIGLSTAVA